MSGTYVGETVDRKPLPAEETVASGDGYTHWVRIEKVILRLRGDGQYSMSVKYYHQHLAPGQRGRSIQLLDDASRGTFRASGDALVFVPLTKRSGRSSRPVEGRIRGDRITVDFRVRDGNRWRPVSVVVALDRTYW